MKSTVRTARAGSWRRRSALLVTALCLVAGAAQATNSGPVVRLFPTTVLEDIRETGQVAEDMENNLQQIIHRLDMQQQLYTESLCQGADGDQGCERIAKQLGSTYLEMLEVMSDRLPEMERAVNSTRTSLEKRLRQELGQRTTPTSLQNQPARSRRHCGGKPADRSPGAARPFGRAPVRPLQAVLRPRLHAPRTGPASRMAVIASDIYLDMEEASHLIAATQQEINRAALMEQLNQSFGLITPEMAAVVERRERAFSSANRPDADSPDRRPPLCDRWARANSSARWKCKRNPGTKEISKC